MSLKDRIAVLQQRNVDSHSPSAAVGHAAPLRAKIAQFESKGGVPVPRGSFGIGAPPVIDRGQKRGELYGNRMKPVWVPSGGPPSLASRQRMQDDVPRRAREDASHGVRGDVADHLPSPPESPPAGRSLSPTGGPLSPAGGPLSPVLYDLAEQSVMAIDSRDEDLKEIPDEDVDEEIVDVPVSSTDVPSPSEEGSHQYTPASPSQEENMPASPFQEESARQLSASPPQEDSAQHIPASPSEVAGPSSSPPSPSRVSERSSSPPLPPSPPLSPMDLSLPDGLHDASPVEYGTVVLETPFRSQHRQGQSFSSVVHGRVRERPRVCDKQLPPTPPSPAAYVSNSDLDALLKDSAALERRLVAGDLPAEALRRLSARPPPISKDRFGDGASPPSRSSSADSTHKEAKVKHTFRNPLAWKHKKDSAPHDAASVAPTRAVDTADTLHASTWFSEPASTPVSGWRKLATTSRLRRPPVTGLEHAPRTLITP